jgi:signal transduction histidine kinase
MLYIKFGLSHKSNSMIKGIEKPFFLLFALVITLQALSSERFTSAQIDSLRKQLGKTGGKDRISLQLDLAEEIFENDDREAQNLAISGLRASKDEADNNLQARAYYILGQISANQNKKIIAEAFYDTALTISGVSQNNWLKGEILYRKGVIKHERSEEIEALKYFNESLQASRLSNNFKTMGSSYSMMGTIFRVNGLYDRAIEYIINARLNYEKANSQEGKAWSSYILGRIYADLKLLNKGKDYFQDALAIYTKLAAIDGNEEGIAICMEQMGLLSWELGDFREAQTYISKAFLIYTARNSKYGLASTHKDLGIIEYSMGNYKVAKEYLNEALKISNEIGEKLGIATIYEYIGLCNIGEGRVGEGLSDLNKGLSIATENSQRRLQLNIYAKLTEVYLKLNDTKSAIQSQNKQIEIQNLILSGAANIKIEQLQAIYEIDKKNDLIVELEKQNEINVLTIRQHKTSQLIMIVGIFIVVVILVIVYWFNIKIRQKNAQLKEANAAKDKLFAIIAHDLRGPTGNMTYFLEHIKDSFNDFSPEELKKILESLYQSAENVNILLENLLIWAQSQLNKLVIKREKYDLKGIVVESLRGITPSAKGKEIALKFDLKDDLEVFADRQMVETILRNLYSNAVKFTQRGGWVAIKTEKKDDKYARVSISDNGVGIEKGALSKIFDINSNFHTPGTENEKSTGLGLILVKDFVEKNNGTIAVESSAGKGTTVSFTLPLA